ncbi:hypothetical protein VP01_2646g2 [Puccinia sorghi]|uniref:Uncharacterized protein n=1 Tax=Puccinia sorghi TaxID=27349 RepID=A0A0L6V474_9BASI|nr:hypothetical protein VP01_2646g2 [Puccinia sorghi]
MLTVIVKKEQSYPYPKWCVFNQAFHKTLSYLYKRYPSWLKDKEGDIKPEYWHTLNHLLRLANPNLVTIIYNPIHPCCIFSHFSLLFSSSLSHSILTIKPHPLPTTGMPRVSHSLIHFKVTFCVLTALFTVQNIHFMFCLSFSFLVIVFLISFSFNPNHKTSITSDHSTLDCSKGVLAAFSSVSDSSCTHRTIHCLKFLLPACPLDKIPRVLYAAQALQVLHQLKQTYRHNQVGELQGQNNTCYWYPLLTKKIPHHLEGDHRLLKVKLNPKSIDCLPVVPCSYLKVVQHGGGWTSLWQPRKSRHQRITSRSLWVTDPKCNPYSKHHEKTSVTCYEVTYQFTKGPFEQVKLVFSCLKDGIGVATPRNPQD